jgi:hypothetical protein
MSIHGRLTHLLRKIVLIKKNLLKMSWNVYGAVCEETRMDREVTQITNRFGAVPRSHQMTSDSFRYNYSFTIVIESIKKQTNPSFQKNTNPIC